MSDYADALNEADLFVPGASKISYILYMIFCILAAFF